MVFIEASRSKMHSVTGTSFIDCSGFADCLFRACDCMRASDDWSKWLPCERAFRVPSPVPATHPFPTLSTAHRRLAVGGFPPAPPASYVFCAATQLGRGCLTLLATSMPSAGAPRLINSPPYVGARPCSATAWRLGLASGFPRSTRIPLSLVESGIRQSRRLFPAAGSNRSSRMHPTS